MYCCHLCKTCAVMVPPSISTMNSASPSPSSILEPSQSVVALKTQPCPECESCASTNAASCADCEPVCPDPSTCTEECVVVCNDLCPEGVCSSEDCPDAGLRDGWMCESGDCFQAQDQASHQRRVLCDNSNSNTGPIVEYRTTWTDYIYVACSRLFG